MQRFYAAVTDYQADFFQTNFYRLYDASEHSRGRVTCKQPGRMRWQYVAPERVLLVSDGQGLWVYDRERKQALLSSQPSSPPAALSFLAGQGDLATESRARLVPRSSHTFAGGHVVELRPRTPNPQVERVVLFVESRSFQLIRYQAIEHSGNRLELELTNIRVNQGVADSHFTFRAPAGVRVLRQGAAARP
jgi:outer membrane lipoprotein carrier protein